MIKIEWYHDEIPFLDHITAGWCDFFPLNNWINKFIIIDIKGFNLYNLYSNSKCYII